MHIQTVNYTRTFNLGNYSSEKIGVEIAINEGENAKQALEEAKKLVEEFHEENVTKLKELGFYPYEEEPVEVIKTQSKQTLAEKTKSFIDLCKNEEELKAWELMAKSNTELKEYYNEKLKTFKTK